jgi:transposase
MAEGRLESDGRPSDRPRAAWYSWMRWEPMPPFLLFMPGQREDKEPTVRWRATAEPIPQLLASMTLEGMGTCLAVEGATTAAVFEAYIEKVLLPSLQCRQLVVMDNLSAHKGERIRELVESAGCELLYLPPYSPNLNPIEEAFSKIKGLLRKAQGRSRQALVEAMGKALDSVTAQDAKGYFEHCGYGALDQSF